MRGERKEQKEQVGGIKVEEAKIESEWERNSVEVKPEYYLIISVPLCLIHAAHAKIKSTLYFKPDSLSQTGLTV